MTVMPLAKQDQNSAFSLSEKKKMPMAHRESQ